MNCKVIAIENQKGGTGKSTTALNLGVGLKMKGKKVLLNALTDILHYINQNYNEALSLSLLSKKFAFSESYIARLFKTQLNTTVSTHINNIRLEHASNYISNTNLSIAEIAELCGYNDIAYFSRKYKNKYGESPKSSRNRL